ncbi:MAG TPA: hypothetical protein DHN33_09135 [Eubacteriaceae bacterium]|nr:hypothetical protein [Eubacteriaceae bacterium]
MNFKEILKDKKYTKAFSESKLFEKIFKFAKEAGIKVVYTVLLLFYAYKKPSTPRWAKNIIIGALGYFIVPFDFIPDIIPGIGYTDDLSALVFALVTVAAYIDEDVKLQAKSKLKDWFGIVDESKIEEIEGKMERGEK